jgi:methyl-accepting chemotaxis protein
MKGRLNSTIWMLIAGNFIAVLAVMWLGYSAGAEAKVASVLDAIGTSSAAGIRLLGAAAVLVVVSVVLLVMLGNRVVKPVNELAEFSEKLANGDYRAKADIEAADDFGFIAENFNRSAEHMTR